MGARDFWFAPRRTVKSRALKSTLARRSITVGRGNFSLPRVGAEGATPFARCGCLRYSRIVAARFAS